MNELQVIPEWNQESMIVKEKEQPFIRYEHNLTSKDVIVQARSLSSYDDLIEAISSELRDKVTKPTIAKILRKIRKQDTENSLGIINTQKWDESLTPAIKDKLEDLKNNKINLYNRFMKEGVKIEQKIKIDFNISRKKHTILIKKQTYCTEVNKAIISYLEQIGIPREDLIPIKKLTEKNQYDSFDQYTTQKAKFLTELEPEGLLQDIIKKNEERNKRIIEDKQWNHQ